MLVVVPTRGRVENQMTLSNLTPALRRSVRVVCPDREAGRIESVWGGRVHSVTRQPDGDMTIAQKRKWIVDTARADGVEKLVMLDDDLRFCVRRDDDPGKFRQSRPEDVDAYFAELAEKLTPLVPHAGFGVRGGGISDRDKQGGWQEAKRMMYVLGYHVPTVAKHATFGRIETREDMDVTLQLLLRGLPNLVCKTFVTDQKTGWGDKGGCSGQRTVESSNSDAEKLAELHPGFVRVVEKTYAGTHVTGSVTRKEVVCSWEKALAAGKQRRDAGDRDGQVSSGGSGRGRVSRSPR